MKSSNKFSRHWWLLIITGLTLITILFLEISERKNSFLKAWLYENNASKKLIVATVAITPDKSPVVSRQKMVDFISKIKEEQPNVSVIFFGETILGWYELGNKNYHSEVAESIPGIITDSIAELAKENNIFISFGMVEKTDEKIYNSQVLIDDKGQIINVQRKKNVRAEGFNSGQESIALVDIRGVRAGIVICYDMRSNETIAKARDNADVIFLSNADYMDKWDKSHFGYKYLAKQFNTWIVTSNRYGKENDVQWDGQIEILNPFGDLLVSGNMKEQFVIYEIKINHNQSGFRYFNQKIYSKISLVYLVLKNLKTALSYL